KARCTPRSRRPRASSASTSCPTARTSPTGSRSAPPASPTSPRSMRWRAATCSPTRSPSSAPRTSSSVRSIADATEKTGTDTFFLYLPPGGGAQAGEGRDSSFWEKTWSVPDFGFCMLSAESLKKIDREIAKYPPDQKRSAVMSALIVAQDEKGWLAPEVMDFVADYLGMPPVAVYEVASFYTMYNLQKTGGHKLHI